MLVNTRQSGKAVGKKFREKHWCQCCTLVYMTSHGYPQNITLSEFQEIIELTGAFLSNRRVQTFLSRFITQISSAFQLFGANLNETTLQLEKGKIKNEFKNDSGAPPLK